MGGRIFIDKDLPEDERTLALADSILTELRRLTGCNALPGNGSELGNALFAISRLGALGSVARLWIYADTHVRNDSTLAVDLDKLSEVTALPLWVLRAFSPKWLTGGNGDVTRLPEYVDKNALISREKRRIANRKRVKKWRRKHGKSGNALRGKRGKKRNAVTPKSRNAHVTHPRAGARARATGTGTGTETTGTETRTGTPPASAPLAATPERAAAAREELRTLADRMRMPGAAEKDGP